MLGWTPTAGTMSATQPSGSDLTAALDFTREAGSYPSMRVFRESIPAALARLVPCDVSGYNEVDPARDRTLVLMEPAGVMYDGVEEALERVQDQHPLIQRG